MYARRAIDVYQTTANTTTPAIDSIVRLLDEMSTVISDISVDCGCSHKEVAGQLRTLQYALFELMGVVDHRSDEGKRLLMLYVHLNQSLVAVQLHKQYDLLPDIREQIDSLSDAWSAARQNQRRQRFTTDML